MQNIIGIIDNLGIKLCDYKYDSFGNVSVVNYNSTIGSINSIRYKGYYYDKEIGLYYCINRYYNPSLGRWLTIDNPKYIDRYNINSLNLYAYCENNPKSSISLSTITDNNYNIMNTDIRKKQNGNNEIFNFFDIAYVFKEHETFSILNGLTLNHMFTTSDVLIFDIVDINYTMTLQNYIKNGMYFYTDIGNDEKSIGFGININNIICYERSYSSNYTIGFYYQIGGSFTFGISYGNYDTLTINVGVQHELETQSINISVRGVGVMLVAQSIPIHYNKCIQMGPAIALSVADYRYNNSFF